MTVRKMEILIIWLDWEMCLIVLQMLSQCKIKKGTTFPFFHVKYNACYFDFVLKYGPGMFV